MTISNLSTTAANNDSPVPAGAPEGMAPGQVNNVIRENMADNRLQWNDAEWFEYRDGTPDGVAAYVSTNQFKITGADASVYYHIGRRVKISGTSDIYGSITAVAYAAGDTTVTVDASIINETITVYCGILSATNDALPREAVQDIIGAMIAGNSETGLAATYDDTNGKLDFNVTITQEDFTTILKTKLDGIAAAANNYSHPTTAGNKHIPTGGSSGQLLQYSASGTAAWYSLPSYAGASHNHSAADLTSGTINAARYASTANAYGTRTSTTSTATPTGGAAGDIHYIYNA